MLDMYDFNNDIWLCHSFNGQCFNITAFVSTDSQDTRNFYHRRYISIVFCCSFAATRYQCVERNSSFLGEKPDRDRHHLHWRLCHVSSGPSEIVQCIRPRSVHVPPFGDAEKRSRLADSGWYGAEESTLGCLHIQIIQGECPRNRVWMELRSGKSVWVNLISQIL